jgi:serine/threonine protein kinase
MGSRARVVVSSIEQIAVSSSAKPLATVHYPMSPERWQQISRLFGEVLECEPHQRAALLDAACADDADLRREVESLLAAREDAGDFMRQPAFELEAKQSATPLPTGQLIAHFEVIEPLGAGAMGEVYLVRDTRLDRKVALKLLPLRFTLDNSRLRRFEREARTASALNHQNIITVFEIGKESTPEGERHYIATEYVEGVTLRERLSQSALPLDQTLDIARQIAAALSAAHANNIVHRDIKPENVMLRPDGVVKVLDFGIAKLTESDARNADSPAQAHPHSTVQGMVIGTPGYMSPEQARGLEVDARTDIFSLGVVLYEMVAGQLPFRGTTNADAIVSLLEHEPEPITVCAPDAPDELEEIITRALAKDRDRRYQTIQDLQAALQALEQQLIQPGYRARAFSTKRMLRRFRGQPAKTRQARNSWLGLALALGIVAALSAVGYLAAHFSKQTGAFKQANWKTSPLFSHKVGAKGWLSPVFFSPDGKMTAYSLHDEQGSHIWVKRLDSGEARQLTDDKWEDYYPVWSPNGQKLAFFSNRENKRGFWTVSVSGGEPTLLCEITAHVYYSVGWFHDNRGERIYFVATKEPHNLQMVDLQTRVVSPLTNLPTTASHFSISPDEQQIAYAQRAGSLSQIMIQPLPTGRPRQVASGEGILRFPVWFPDGRTLAYVSNRSGIYQLYLTDITGQEATQLTLSENHLDLSAVSPDGNKLIGSSRRQPANIWVWDLQTGTESEQTEELGSHFLPAVSPSGNEFVFVAAKDEIHFNEDIFIKLRGQQNQPTKLTHGFGGKWSPDGNTLLFFRLTSGKRGLWTFDVNSKNALELIPDDIFLSNRSFVPFNLEADTYSWSYDGNAIAFCARAANVTNLWMMAKDGSDKRQITNNSDPQTKIHSPIWSPDNSLAYFSSLKDVAANKQPHRLSVYRADKAEEVFKSDNYFKLLGWSASGQEIFLASGTDIFAPKEFDLLSLEVASGKTKPLARLTVVYLHSIKLSNDRQHFAFVSRKNGKDNIEILHVTSGLPRKITNNSDTYVYYSGLTWEPSGKRLFYSKQKSWVAATIIERLP